MGIVCEPPTRATSSCARVDELIRSHKGELLWSAGVHAAIQELIVRSEAHEEAIREMAREIQELAAGLERLSGAHSGQY